MTRTSNESNPTKKEIDWVAFEQQISNWCKKNGVAAIGVLGLLLALTFGSQFVYTLLGLAAIGVYMAYTKEVENWLENNQGMLIGGSFGFFYAGPIGLALGAWLGHFLHGKYTQMTQAANSIAEAVRPVVAPKEWLAEKGSNLYKKGAEVLQSVNDYLDENLFKDDDIDRAEAAAAAAAPAAEPPSLMQVFAEAKEAVASLLPVPRNDDKDAAPVDPAPDILPHPAPVIYSRPADLSPAPASSSWWTGLKEACKSMRSNGPFTIM